MRCVLARDSLVQAPVVLILDLAIAGPVGVLTVRTGYQFGEGVGEQKIQTMIEAVLEAALQDVEGHMAIVLAAGVAANAGILRKRPQGLLKLQVGWKIRIGQFETGSNYDGIVQNGADGLAQQRSIDGPILRVKLILILLPG